MLSKRTICLSVLMVCTATSTLSDAIGKGKKDNTDKYVKDLVDCAEINDGKCVLGLTEALKSDSGKACPKLASQLGTKDSRAALVVGAMADLSCPQTADVAIAYVRAAEDESRADVLFAAAPTRDPKLLAVAVEFMATTRGYEKETACRVAGQVGNDEAIKILLQASADANFAVRIRAVMELGRFKNVESQMRLGELLAKDTNSGVRAEAARALGRQGTFDSIPYLIAGMGDNDPDVHFAAHEAIVAIAGMDLGFKPGPWNDWWMNGAPR